MGSVLLFNLNGGISLFCFMRPRNPPLSVHLLKTHQIRSDTMNYIKNYCDGTAMSSIISSFLFFYELKVFECLLDLYVEPWKDSQSCNIGRRLSFSKTILKYSHIAMLCLVVFLSLPYTLSNLFSNSSYAPTKSAGWEWLLYSKLGRFTIRHA